MEPSSGKVNFKFASPRRISKNRISSLSSTVSQPEFTDRNSKSLKLMPFKFSQVKAFLGRKTEEQKKNPFPGSGSSEDLRSGGATSSGFCYRPSIYRSRSFMDFGSLSKTSKFEIPDDILSDYVNPNPLFPSCKSPERPGRPNEEVDEEIAKMQHRRYGLDATITENLNEFLKFGVSPDANREEDRSTRASSQFGQE